MAFFGSIGRALKSIVRQVEEQQGNRKESEKSKTPEQSRAKKQITQKEIRRAGVEAQSGIVRGIGVPASRARAVRDVAMMQQIRTNSRR